MAPATNPPSPTLDGLNTGSRAGFLAALGSIFEHAPWVAEVAVSRRPFSTLAALHDAMVAALRQADAGRQLTLIRAHPELGSKVARAGLTAASQSEQGSLGLDRLSDEEFARFNRLNAAYRARFGFPFIICVRRHTRDSILRQFERRLANDVDTERAAALDEIALITRLRIVNAVDGPGKPATEGLLTTHVLDLVHGKPAAGVRLALYEVGDSARGLLREAVTNIDGRTEAALISGEPLRIGTYELQFHVGDYFGADGFLGVVPVRFSVAEPESHYHVPLLATPWSYSTNRGS